MNVAHAVATVVRASTTVFFLKALELLQPDLIVDVGSRDGREALLFRTVAPRARIVACEANPSLAARMRADERLRDSHVEVVHAALSNAEGTRELHIADRSLGNGSLHAWRDRESLERVTVPARRLDRVVTARDGETVGLWIDVEGHAHEVLEGAGELLERVSVVHVEVETTERWRGARLAPDIVSFMRARGFRDAHTVIDAATGQGDIVFINNQAALTDARLCSKITRYAAYRPLATLANAARLKERVPGGYGVLKNTVGAFLKR